MGHPPSGYGIWFYCVCTLLPSHCGGFFVFRHRVFFLVGFSVFLLMVVQQLVVILALSQEEISTRPSSPPSWTGSPHVFFLFGWLFCFVFNQLITLWVQLFRFGYLADTVLRMNLMRLNSRKTGDNFYCQWQNSDFQRKLKFWNIYLCRSELDNFPVLKDFFSEIWDDINGCDVLLLYKESCQHQEDLHN